MGLVAFIGAGRPLTKKGNLRLADGRSLVDLLGTGDVIDGFRGSDMPNTTRTTEQLPNLDLTFRVAREAGFVKVRRGKVEPTLRAADLDAHPEQAWPLVATGLVDLGILDHRYAGRTYLLPPWIEDLDSALPHLLAVLYLAEGPLLIDELVGIARESLAATWRLEPLEEDDGGQGWSWGRVLEDDVRLQLRRLAEVGVCAVHDVEQVVARFGVQRAVGGTVELTAGGRQVTAALLRERGATVPEAGRLHHLDAPALLDALAVASLAEVAAEVMVWVDARDPDEGFGQLVDAVAGRSAELPLTVVAAMLLAAAAAVGVSAAEPGMRRLLEDRLLAPVVAGGWLRGDSTSRRSMRWTGWWRWRPWDWATRRSSACRPPGRLRSSGVCSVPPVPIGVNRRCHCCRPSPTCTRTSPSPKPPARRCSLSACGAEVSAPVRRRAGASDRHCSSACASAASTGLRCRRVSVASPRGTARSPQGLVPALPLGEPLTHGVVTTLVRPSVCGRPVRSPPARSWRTAVAAGPSCG